jgi:predicted site-specific integrase-resolvase
MRRMTTKDIGDMYGVNRRTVMRWVQHYGLPVFQVSPKCLFIREDDLKEWEDRLKSSNRCSGQGYE